VTAWASADPPGTRDVPGMRPSWVDLGGVLGVALVLRLLTFHGIFGSDDGVYMDRAIDVANGVWTSANYNGALRYGFNIPAGGFVWLFGPSPFVVNLWPLLCSLIEVGLVYLMGSSVAGRRAGVLAALLLATAPLHISVATRIHADSVVAMFLTLSFVLLWFGWCDRNRKLLFAAGLAAGGVFWAKELVAVTWLALLPMVWLFRRRRGDALVVVAATLLMLGLHGLLMTAIAGDPFHLVRTVLGQVQTSFIGAGLGEDAPGYYLKYLFVDVRHTGVLGLLATAGAVALLLRRMRSEGGAPLAGLAYVLVWLVGLFAVLSVLPVSVSPVRFVMKQSNYITLFMAPMAILAGFALSLLKRPAAVVLAAVGAVIGVLFALLQQADYRAFTANSKALAAFAVEHPRAVVLGSANNARLTPFWARLTRPGEQAAMIIDVDAYLEQDAATRQRMRDAGERFAVLDPQTLDWQTSKLQPKGPLPCWRHEQTLEPTGLALGNLVAQRLGAVIEPIAILTHHIERLARPRPANVYRVSGPDLLCRPE